MTIRLFTMCFLNLKTEDWKIIDKIIRLKISHSILQIQLVLIKQKNYLQLGLTIMKIEIPIPISCIVGICTAGGPLFGKKTTDDTKSQCPIKAEFCNKFKKIACYN